MNIEITQPQETSIKSSIALGMKSVLLASSDLAQGARPWARSVGLVGQIIENNLLIEVLNQLMSWLLLSLRLLHDSLS